MSLRTYFGQVNHQSLVRLITSHFRWILSWCSSRHKTGYIFWISPPLSKRQILISRSKSKWDFIRIHISTYFDWATIHEVFIRREYSLDRFPQLESVIEAMKRAKNAGKTALILDFGANIGVASRFFTTEFPGVKVIALEPSSKNFQTLSKNLQGGDFKLIHGAIGPRTGQLSLFDPGIGNNAFRTFGEGTSVESVPQLSVQNILEEYPDAELLVVKIDIEGYETALFSENTDWIDRTKVIVIETHDWMLPGRAISQNLINALAGRNRDLIFRGENLFSIRNDN